MSTYDHQGTGGIITTSRIDESNKQPRVLDGLDPSVRRGTVFALVGPNGYGKTTKIWILSTPLKMDAGPDKIMGFDVVKQLEDVRRVIRLIGQYTAVDELLPGEENMPMMGRL